MSVADKKLIFKVRYLEQQLIDCRAVCERSRPDFVRVLNAQFPRDSDSWIFPDNMNVLETGGSKVSTNDVESAPKKTLLQGQKETQIVGQSPYIGK